MSKEHNLVTFGANSRRLRFEGSLPAMAAPHPIATTALILTTVTVFVFSSLVEDSTGRSWLVDLAVKSNQGIHHGELWRLISPMFIHVDSFHLLVNLIVLWLFAPVLEARMGALRFLLVFIVSGLSGIVYGYAFHEFSSAGASGALMGVIASLIISLLVSKKRSPLTNRQMKLLLVSGSGLLGLGLLQPGIDNWAHLGGFVGGSLTTLIIVNLGTGPRPRAHVRLTAAATLLLSTYGALEQGHRWMRRVTRGQLALAQADYSRAEELFRTAHRERPSAPTPLRELGRLSLESGQLEAARVYLQQVVDRFPRDQDAVRLLAETHFRFGEADLAIRLLEDCAALGSDFPGIDAILGRYYQESGLPQEAVPYLQQALLDSPEDQDSRSRLISALRTLGRRYEAEETLAAYESLLRVRLATNAQDIAALGALAQLLLRSNRQLSAALDLARRGVELDPHDPELKATLGCLELMNGNPATSLNLLEEAIRDKGWDQRKAADHYFAAMSSIRLGDEPRAYRHLKAAIQLDPTSMLRKQAEEAIESRALPEHESILAR